jgi:arginyl-tRNA synthetase
MVSTNPFGDFRKECEQALKEVLIKFFPSISVSSLLLDIPPNPEFGELASAIFFELGKKMKEQPRKLAEQTLEAIKVENFPLIDAVKVAGGGYVNFYANFDKLSKTTIDSARALDADYGYV